MKQLLPVLAFLVAFGCTSASAQTSKDTTKAPIVALKQPTDSTGLLTAKDLQELIQLIQDYPAKYANPITNWLQQRFQLRATEYSTKPKTLKP